MQSWLARAGWSVAARRTEQSDNPYASDHLLTLESTRPPRGVKVAATVRTYEVHGNWWTQEQLLGVTVRYPSQTVSSGPAPEVYLTGAEAEPPGYRQLARVLTWFRDPISGALWEEVPGPGDWLPPAEWEAARWGPPFCVEYGWDVCAEPMDMLRALPGQPSERRLRLVACACCRLMPLEMQHERNRLAVDAAERNAEGLTPRREMKKVCKHSDLAWFLQADALALALEAVARLVEERPTEGPRLAAQVVRDVMGNPFRPASLRRSWLRNNGGAAAHLAAAITAEGRHDEMPILADALEDAGCADLALLDHCRGPGPHVRGCWALDLLRPVERAP
jgi:hypothetical protein